MISLSRPLLNPIFRRGFIIAFFAAITAAQSVYATAVGIDLSNFHGHQWDVKTSFNDLNGTPLLGETISLDFTWSSKNFVRLFTITSTDFAASIVLGTAGSEPPAFLEGTGYLIDRYGMAIPGFGITGSYTINKNISVLSLLPFWKDDTGTPNDNLARPLDFYGVHFDLTFPDLSDPSAQVTWGSFWLSDHDGGFGVGPRVPADIVPDLGSTLFFLGIGVAGIYGIKIRLFPTPR